MIPEEDLFIERAGVNSFSNFGLRLLEVDSRLYLPIEKQIRLFITASDVLHS
jgi:heme/copper-type cytochrome/quinol oxidase subunit 2